MNSVGREPLCKKVSDTSVIEGEVDLLRDLRSFLTEAWRTRGDMGDVERIKSFTSMDYAVTERQQHARLR